MRVMTGSLATALTVGIVFATSCRKESAPKPLPVPNYAAAAVQAGGTLNSDGSVTNANGSTTEPNGAVLPPAAPSTPQAVSGSPPSGGTAAPAAGETNGIAPAQVLAPSGTAVTIRTTEQLSASHNQVGDHFSAVLDRAVVVHGAVIFAKGTPVTGEVVAARGKGRFKGAGDLGIELTSIDNDHVSTGEYEQVVKGRGKRTGTLIGGGAGLGALIGGLAGGGKGALIGGLAGAGGGTAASAYTGTRDVIIRSESVISFRLRAPLSRKT